MGMKHHSVDLPWLFNRTHTMKPLGVSSYSPLLVALRGALEQKSFLYLTLFPLDEFQRLATHSHIVRVNF